MSETETETAVEWWITTGVKTANGQKVLGPFVTQNLAFEVRALAERAEGHHHYWIEDFPAQA
jgi:hypothetical protein